MPLFAHQPLPIEAYRFERKFLTPMSPRQIEQVIKLNPALFSEIYHYRTVNNIYLDSPELDCFDRTVNGDKERIKVRIRWYGDPFGPVEKPVLEIKRKQSLLGSKESYPLAPIVVSPALTNKQLHELFERSRLPPEVKEDLHGLEASLLNSYGRKYFLSDDKEYRVTIDQDLMFCDIGPQGLNPLKQATNRDESVVELKYDFSQDSGAASISNAFPFRMTKSSKYEQGILTLRDL